MNERTTHGRVVVRAGLLVDGTGAAPRPADLVLDHGAVAEITALGAAATGGSEIDAEGCWVTPGFIDPHTHLDAQLFWDPTGNPSVHHGVTTVITGNCGFGVAPCGDDAETFLLRCLEAVEEIPFASTVEGVPFGWHSFSSYLDALDALPLGVNVAAMVPHSPLRHAVMGERARDGLATDDDLWRMAAELDEALAAGALGFATSRGPNHVDGDGRPVPSRFADDRELQALVERCRGRVWQINLGSKGDRTGEASRAEIGTYAAWSAQAGADLSWTPLLIGAGDTVVWRSLVDHSRRLANDLGVAVLPQVSPTPLVSTIDFSGRSLAESIRGWEVAVRRLDGLSVEERCGVLADSSFRDVLRAAPEDPGSMLAPAYARWRVQVSPRHPQVVGRTLAEIAAQDGRHPVDVLCDLAVADRLETVVEVPLANTDSDEVAEAVVEAGVMVGLGDAGAHVASITNFAYPTFLLRDAVLERGSMSIVDAVERLCSVPGRLFGLGDRGRLTVGAPADVNVIDPDTLALGAVERRNDLPGGAGRLFRGARGMRAVIVGGAPVLLDDTPVPTASGRVLRRS